MASYQALYRTYRPQLFREVVGQEVVVKTLQNAILNNKISHAYLFSGPRGTGKTTVARIFAKTLNCENAILQEPCDKCESCMSIADGRSPDVVEIDAASNNGVDEIRDIREKSRFLPSGTKYRIYIIDEVHMLSPGAFNALLKTLEEPPSHVVFILATTEAQKIPATISSRCQRFEFKALSVSEINKKMRLICDEEDVDISEEALTSIAEGAEGALRDALSVLDQAISYSDEKVTIEDVNLVTGSLSYDKIIELVCKFEEQDVTGALEVVHELVENGKEVEKIVNGLLQFYRDMLLYQNVSSAVYTKYIFQKQKFKELAERLDSNRIFYYVEVLSDVQNKIKYSSSPQTYLEIALIKMINMARSDLDYLDRINQIEYRLDNLVIPEASQMQIEGIDQEKVNANEVKINRVISELNKLDLYRLTSRVEELENKPAVITNGEISVNDKALSDVQKELDSIRENLQVIKANYTTIKNQVDYLSSKETDVDLSAFEKRLVDLESKGVPSNIASTIDYLKEDVDAIKLVIAKLNSKVASNDIDDVVEKIDYLEKQIYSVLAQKESNKHTIEPKKSTDKIALFGDNLAPIKEVKEQEVKVDFDDLAKEETSITLKILEDEKASNAFQESLKAEKVIEEKSLEEKLENESVIEEDSIETNNVIEEKEPLEKISLEEKIDEEEIEEDINEFTLEDDLEEIDDEEQESELVENLEEEKVNIFENERKEFEKEAVLNQKVIDIKEENEPLEKGTVVSNDDLKEEEKPLSNVTSEQKISNYDVKNIEKILHESRTESAKNDLQRIKRVWDLLDVSPNPEHVGVVKILKQGRVAAFGNKEFIICFNTASLCNQVMKQSFKSIATDVLKKYLGDVFEYIAITEKAWQEKRTEYISQYNIGIRYPKLTPINDPDLILISPEDEYKDPEEKIIDRAKSRFGKYIKIE